MDSLLQDLSVIGQVPRHGRLGSNRDGLYLEKAGPLQFCKRFLYGDSRTQLIRDLKLLSERVALLREIDPEEVDLRVAKCVEGLDRLYETTYGRAAVIRSCLKIQAGNLQRAASGGGAVQPRQSRTPTSRASYVSQPSQSSQSHGSQASHTSSKRSLDVQNQRQP